jgi:hypothetical protein
VNPEVEEELGDMDGRFCPSISLGFWMELSAFADRAHPKRLFLDEHYLRM